MDLPKWLDVTKIAELAGLTLILIQYFKAQIPDKFIKYVTILVGIALSFATDLYVGATIVPVKSAINGLIAAVTADTTYKFLSSSKSQPFTLPSKAEELKKP